MAFPPKHQAPTSKLQRSTKLQTPKNRRWFWSLVFGISLVLGAWMLVLSRFHLHGFFLLFVLTDRRLAPARHRARDVQIFRLDVRQNQFLRDGRVTLVFRVKHELHDFTAQLLEMRIVVDGLDRK